MSAYDFFQRPLVRSPAEPELIPESERQKTGLDWMSNYLDTKIDSPTLKVAGLSDMEQQGKSILQDIVSGKAFQDPNTSQVYKGLRDEIDAGTAAGVAKLNTQAQNAGMLRSSGAARAITDFITGQEAKKNQILGQMYESERARDNEYTRMNAATQFGAMERDIEDRANQAQFQKVMNDILMEQNKSGVASQLADSGNYFVPQYTQNPSGFENTISVVSAVAPIISSLLMPKPKAPSSSSGLFGSGIGAAANIGSAFIMKSDRNAKREIVPIDGAVDKIKELTGSTYSYIETTPADRTAGVIAQDVEKVLPEAIEVINGVKFVRYEAVIALVVNAVKELAARVEALEERKGGS